jgi:predicted Fe-S protein YdhL (DUF1289 family)
MKYQVTKKQCQNKIKELNNVCDRCGKELEPIKTVNNADEPTYWIGCFHGQKEKGAWGNFTSGVKKEVYKLAYKLVLEDDDFRFKREEGYDFEYLFQNAVAKACSTIIQIEYMKTHKPRYTKKQLRKLV